MTLIYNNKILIHAPNWLGDHVMAFPFYNTVVTLFPDIELHLIARSWVTSLIPHKQEGIPIFSQVIVLADKDPNQEQVDFLKKQNYRLAITLSPSFRSALLLKSLKIPIRIGYKTDARFFLLKYPPQKGSQRIPPINYFEHRSLSYIRLLSNFYHSNKVAENYWMDSLHINWNFPLSESKNIGIQNLYKQYGININKYMVIAPGSISMARTYPIENIIQIMNHLCHITPNIQIILVGSPKEEKYGHTIVNNIRSSITNQVINLIGNTDIEQLIYIIKYAKVVLANDSGVAHLTSLSKSPLVTFFGMGKQWETVSLNTNKDVFNLNLKCSPCGKNICPKKGNSYMKCLLGIKLQDITEAVLKYL